MHCKNCYSAFLFKMAAVNTWSSATSSTMKKGSKDGDKDGNKDGDKEVAKSCM